MSPTAEAVSLERCRHGLPSRAANCKVSAVPPVTSRAMIGVMKVLDRASGGQAPPEFFSTHPKPANRVAYIQQVIAEEFPDGVPDGLEP